VSASFRVVVGRLVGLDGAKAIVLKVRINRHHKKAVMELNETNTAFIHYE
jgi:hypothetical protein